MSAGKDKPATSGSREWTVYVCECCGYVSMNGSWHGCTDGPSVELGKPVVVVPREDAEALVTALKAIANRPYHARTTASIVAQRTLDAYRLAHPGPEPRDETP